MRAELLTHYVEFQRLLTAYLERIPADAWGNRTESRPQGWTLHQTLAHLVTAGEGFQQMVNLRLTEATVRIPGLEKRSDLPEWNRQQIASAVQVTPAELVTRLLSVFATTQAQIAELAESDFDLVIPMPMYNRPGTVAEVFGWQCCHVGIVHAAQLANGANLNPLWQQYEPDFFRWIIMQFINQAAHSYWPERGGELAAKINLIIGGAHSGRWHMSLNSTGGTAAVELAPNARVTLRFRNAHTFSQIFTRQVSPIRAIFTGQAFATGDLPLALRLGHLLNPT